MLKRVAAAVPIAFLIIINSLVGPSSAAAPGHAPNATVMTPRDAPANLDCKDLLTHERAEQARAAKSDPAATYRRQHGKTKALPAVVQCESRTWRQAHAVPEADRPPLTRSTGVLQPAPRITPARQQKSDGPAISRGAHVDGNGNGNNGNGNGNGNGNNGNGPANGHGKPVEIVIKHAGSSKADLRTLPQEVPEKIERPELEEPEPAPVVAEPEVQPEVRPPSQMSVMRIPSAHVNSIAPPPLANFDGLDFANFGAGHPPDTNGDVGRDYYIQTINTSIGIFDKRDGTRVAAFTFNRFMSQGHFGNLCDTNNFGDPVVLYDTFEDRWIITDFAFKLDATGNPANPAFQCIAASMSGDPVTGGWHFYSISTAGGLGDYPKFGIWPDGLYMSANIFGFSGGPFQNPRVYAFNKAQMYAGSPTVQVVSFDAPSADFTLLPANARLQTGTPPAGTPNYYVSTWQFLNAVGVYRFHVDWDRTSLSTFTGPFLVINPTSWPNASVANAPSLGGNLLDVLQIRAMMQNQYTNLGGAESLWTTHTVRRGDTTGFAAPRFYQLPVTGGTIGPVTTQGATFDPDGANVMFRFMPSLAIDTAGNMALGYSTSSSTTKPAIKYAGRLSTDPPNAFSQTEQVLIQGTGTQTGNCGSTCIRWGDYSAMTLDPNGCTFWNTNMYYNTDGLAFLTRVGSFQFTPCTTVGNGAVSGTVTAAGSGAPLGGAIVALGSRLTTTNAAGFYAFLDVPAGTYPGLTVSFPGYSGGNAANIVVPDGGTATQDFALTAASANACLTDTTQADFQAGVATNVDMTAAGDVQLSAPPVVEQNTNVTNSGFGFNATNWAGQTFTAPASGQLTRVDLDLFCSGCTGTTPNITVSIRNTAGTTPVPTGADLATATIPGFSSGAGGFFTATFATPLNITAGTRYAVIFRPVANPSAGIYAYVVSSANPYPNGQRVTSPNSGATWAADVTNGGRDLGFKAFISAGFTPSGTFVSSLKDANPPAGGAPTWPSLSWTANTPAGTNIRLQAAASNSPFGPFNFVGPDGTAATFFTNGASLAQFNGNRYLRYAALLSTTSSAVTPVLNDVTICYIDTLQSTLTAVPATATFGGSTSLSATLTSAGAPVTGKTISFAINNGASVGSAVTGPDGVATLPNVSVASLNAGTYPFSASFDGDVFNGPASASSTLVVNKADPSIVVTPYHAIFDGHPHTATGTATGVNGEALAGLDLSGTTHTEAGSYLDSWTFTDVTGNYNNTAGTVSDTIARSTALSITISAFNGVYDAAPHGATGTVIGVKGEDLSSLLVFSSTFVNVPGGVTNWSFPGTPDYEPVTGTATVVITKAPLTVTANDAARIYSAANPAFTAGYSGFKGADTFASSVSGAPSLTTTATPLSAAGKYTITAANGTLGAGNYSFSFVNGTLTVFVSGFVGLDSASVGAAKTSGDSFDSTSGYPSSRSANMLILSNGKVDIGGASIFGSVVSALGAVNLQPGSSVSGDVRAGTTIASKGTVLGTSTPNQIAGAITAPAVPPCGAFSTDPATWISGNYSYANGDLRIAGGSTAILAAGTYCFHSVTLVGQSTLQVNGPVHINITGTFSASGGSLSNSSHVPANLQIASSYSGAGGVSLSGGASAYLTVYAPSTDVTVGGSTSLFGAVLGKTLTISGNTDFHLDTQLPAIWAAFYGF